MAVPFLAWTYYCFLCLELACLLPPQGWRGALEGQDSPHLTDLKLWLWLSHLTHYLKLRPHFLGPAGIRDWGSSLGGVCAGSPEDHPPHRWLYFIARPCAEDVLLLEVGWWLPLWPLVLSPPPSHMYRRLFLFGVGWPPLVNPQINFNRTVYQRSLR